MIVVLGQCRETQHGMEVPQEFTDTIMVDQRTVGAGVGSDVVLDRRSPDEEVLLPRK